MVEQRGHRGVLATVERPLVVPDHDRVPAPARAGQRATSAAASGRRAHTIDRLNPPSQNSATMRPYPATTARAWSRCRASDVTGSC